ETLKDMTNSEWIKVFDPYNLDSLCKCIKEALILADKQKGMRTTIENINNIFSTQAYSKRYNDFLQKII
ncbi:hypothetical protein IR127_12360, partial [Lactobacillus murinus]|nr:hypothetical protein [Ligilactobacillus murinus]